MSKERSEQTSASIPTWLSTFNTALVDRIDLGLEGDWSNSVRTIWTREDGRRSPDSGSGEQPPGPHPLEPRPLEPHPNFRPALELYLADGWIGVHCFRYDVDHYVVDAERLEALIRFVETK